MQTLMGWISRPPTTVMSALPAFLSASARSTSVRWSRASSKPFA